MLKQFIKDTGLYGSARIFSKGVAIFLVPLYTRVFTPYDYGIIDMVAVIAAVVAGVVPLQILQALARFIADDKTKSEIIKTSSIGLFVTVFNFSIFLIIIFLFSTPLTKLIFNKETPIIIIRLAALAMFSTALFSFVQNQFRWIHKPKRFVTLSFIYTILAISLTVFFVLIIKIGVIGVFIAQITAGLFCFTIGLIWGRDNYAFRFDLKKFREMIRYSFPLIPAGVGVYFINYAQRIIVKGTLGLANLGLFGISFRLASIFNILFQGIRGSALPLIYENYKKQNTPAEIARIFRYITIVFFTLFVFISLFSKEILIILTTPKYYSAHVFVPFLLLDQYFNGVLVFLPGLNIAKKTKTIAIIQISGAIVSIGFSFIFIYYYGLMGAAIAAALKSTVIFCIKYYFSQRRYHIPFEVNRISLALFIGIILVISGYLYLTLNNFTTYTFKLLITIIFIIILFILRLISFKELKNFYCKIKLYFSTLR